MIDPFPIWRADNPEGIHASYLMWLDTQWGRFLDWMIDMGMMDRTRHPQPSDFHDLFGQWLVADRHTRRVEQVARRAA